MKWTITFIIVILATFSYLQASKNTDLANIKWSVSYDDNTTIRKKLRFTKPLYHLQLSEYFGILIVDNNCIPFSARYSIDRNKLVISALPKCNGSNCAVIGQGCSNSKRDALIRTALLREHTYIVKNNQLTLISNDGKQLNFTGTPARDKLSKLVNALLRKTIEIFSWVL